MKYQYKTFETHSKTMDIFLLNDYGAAGWELISVITLMRGGTSIGIVYYFKRVIE